MSVRYEDFVADPRGTVNRVLSFAGHLIPLNALDHLERDSVELQRRHLVAGNPMRFTHGRIEIAVDQEWRLKMPVRQRRLVSALTVRLRRRHGYE